MADSSRRARLPLRFPLAALALLVALGAGNDRARAQDAPSAAKPAELVRVLESADADDLTRLDAVEALLAVGVDGARRVRDSVARSAKRERAAFDALRKKHLAAVGKQARRVVQQQQKRAKKGELDATQDRLRALNSDPKLTKDQVRNDADPLLARLRELLTVDAATVLQSKPKLAEQDERLTLHVERLGELFRFDERAVEVLTAAGAEGTRHLKRRPPLVDPAPLDRALVADRKFTVLLATPMSSRDAKVLTRNRELAAELVPGEADGVLALNTMRILVGKNALAIDVKACAAARDHSNDMRTLGFFSHTSPVKGKESFGQRASNFGTSARAENIARGQRSGEGANRAWWYSPGHHRNMMNAGHTSVGLGRSEDFWTQLFG